MRAKATSSLVLTLALLFTALQAYAATSPKPGAACSKVNSTQIYKDKKYTCIKSGKKLVWNKGVTVANKKPISNPTPVPSPQTSSGISWNNFGFDDQNRCKLKAVNRDLSDDGPDDLGFPNPSSLLGKSNIRAVGIFVDFPDSTGDSSTVESSKRIAENISSFYSQISYGKVKITWAFTSNFYTLPHKSSYYNFTPEKWLKYGDDQTHYLQDAVDVSDTDIDFSKFDLVLLFPAKTAAPNMPSYAYPGTHSAYFWKIVSKEGLIRNMQSVMASDYQNSDQFVAGRYSNTSWFNIVHEIGHEFMLPDLYQSGLSQEEHSRNVGVYDIMGAYSNSGAGIELNGWSRWTLGFLEDKQVICLTKTGTYQIKLSAIEKADDSQKIAVMPISDSKALLIETRRAIGLDAGLNEKSTGVLTYMLDTSVGTGKGPLKLLLPARSKDTRYLSDAALKVGDTINFSGFEIQVLSSGPDDDVIKIKNSYSLTNSPTPSPSPTPIPTPTPLENWQKLRQDVRAKYEERIKSGRYFDFEFILSPTVNRAKAQETMDAYRQASRYWTWLFGPQGINPIVWVLLTEKDYDWWYAKVTELQGKNSIYPWDKTKNEFGHCQVSDQAFCGYGNGQEAPDGKSKLFQYSLIGSNFQGTPVANTVNHESVHFYQAANTLFYPGDVPCWYAEGQATFYGNVISQTNDSSYELSRIIASLPNSPNWKVAEWVSFLRMIQDNRNECLKDSRNYSIGSFLWEYLLLNYSEEELHRAHVALNTKTWAELAPAFLGKSGDQLTTEFASHLTTIFKRS